MKSFGKFLTFVGVTGAAVAGLWYFLEVNKDKSYAEADGASDTDDSSNERSYVSLDPEIKEELKVAMMLTGSANIEQLSKARYVVLGETREWLEGLKWTQNSI